MAGVRAGRAGGLTAAVLTVSLACAGSGDAPAGMHGTWEWTGTSGGIAGESRLPQPDEPRITLELRANGMAIFRRDGVLARTHAYRIVSERSIYHGTDMPVLYYEREDVGRVVELLDGGTVLTLSDNVYDGFSLQYRRVEEGGGDGR